jgi:DNA-binding NarL/FixJ family response regulator
MPAREKDSTKRILVCCNGCTDALCEALPDASWDVVGCPTCETMLEEALRRPPDLVLCRQNVETAAASATLRLLRRVTQEAPIVVLSESTSIEMLRLAQEFRPVFFVLEPSEPAELREVVRAILASCPVGKIRPSDAILWGRASQ